MSFRKAPCGIISLRHKIGHLLGVNLNSKCQKHWIREDLKRQLTTHKG